MVLAEVLNKAHDLDSALKACVNWVQEQSRAAARAFVLPPAIRDAALRDRCDQTFRDRYRPLILAP
jgi:hypothetical protein